MNRSGFRHLARRAWPVVKFLAGLALGALALGVLLGRRNELSGATSALSNLRWPWVAFGVLLEVGSYAAFADGQRRLLSAGGTAVGRWPMTALTVASTTITGSFPGGPVLATVFLYSQFRRRGADVGLSGWVLAASAVAGAASLALLAAVGVAVAGSEGASLDLLTPIVVVLVVTVLLGAVFLQRRALLWSASRVLQITRAALSWPRGRAAAKADEVVARLTRIDLTPRAAAVAFGCFLASWVFDCGCLVVSFAAIGAGVPWKGLLLAYGAGQLAATLPITPGGLGVVEGSLTIALVYYGGAEATTVAAVLLYRILSFWLEVPIGWTLWAAMTWSSRRSQTAAMLGPMADEGAEP